MLRDYNAELNARVNFIKRLLRKTGAKGVVFGNSGGKDSVLTGVICRKATENVLGVIMPCGSSQNYGRDREDALRVSELYKIDYAEADLKEARDALVRATEKRQRLSAESIANIAPRLRMATLYAVARERNYLVAGTGNRSEIFMGYFTKFGDGAYDFNVISDLTVTEIYEFMEFLEIPADIINKPPSGGLYDGQTDEGEMGVSYKEIDEYILSGKTNARAEAVIKKANKLTSHKRRQPKLYKE